ncbi:MAG: aminodeoxychorismate synthase component I [Flavobacteriales bacterium]
MKNTLILNQTLSLTDIEKLSTSYEQVVFLNSNNDNSISYLAVGKKAELKAKENQVFKELQEFINQHQDWVFGYLGYDLKNEIEPTLLSNNSDEVGFGDFYFFVPEIVVELTIDFTKVHYFENEEKDHFLSILEKNNQKTTKKTKKVNFSQRMSKEEYLEKFKIIKEHIQQGDIYEMNFCHEFFSENTEINSFETYSKLNNLTNAPFSTFYKNGEQFILSGSPERYLKKEGNKIISQPIKGTAKRGKTEKEDKQIKLELSQNQKERSENIMIVDLVRNDLSKTAKKSSVKVEELCKVYSFDTVHQMISTVTSEIDDSVHPVEVLRTTFPMGSMTGAPKVEAMKIIEKLETTKRGVYSGAIGYFKPNQDFDFNVVIRTLLYNKENQYLSFMVGGAITSKATAEQEYEETLLKAEAMILSLK